MLVGLRDVILVVSRSKEYDLGVGRSERCYFRLWV